MTRFSTEARTATGRALFKDKKKEKAATKTPEPPIAVQTGEHGRYQIKSGRLAGEYVARAFPKPPTTTRGLIAEATGATEEAAIAALHAVIDARDVRMNGERRIDETTGFAIPSIEEYTEAMGQVSLSRPQYAMLKALAWAEEDGLPEMRLVSAAGYKSYASANRAFASAGSLIASYLANESGSDGAPVPEDGTTFLGYRGEARSETDAGNWILHTELRDAIRAAG